MTFLMTLALTLVALCIKNEMTWCYGIGATFMLALWPMLIFIIYNPAKTMNGIIAFFGVIISSIYIVIDTEKIMDTYGADDEYIYGALAL